VRLGRFPIARLWKKRIKEPVAGLSIWLAILGILVTMHADIFEQADNRFLALFKYPFERVFSQEPPGIDLSTVLGSTHLGAGGTGNDSDAEALFIFALDLSASMTSRVLSEEEVARYVEDVESTESSECPLPQAELATGFDIALFELCRYLDFVPDGSLAALWTFGDAPRLVAPASDDVGSRYLKFSKTETGGNTRRMFFDTLLDLEPKENLSNFESLLRVLAEDYREEIDGEGDVHFVIISDFSHDIGGEKELLARAKDSDYLVERSRWQSRYRISALFIEDYFRKLSRAGKTFHLSVVLGARQVYCSVLPIAEDSIEWSAYREIRMHPERLVEEFDFLRTYEEAEIPIVFYYTPGSLEPTSRSLIVDRAEYQNARLRVALASEAAGSDELELKLSTRFNEGEKGIVRMGRGHVGTLARAGDEIVLQPLTTLTPREASSYRLLLSLGSGRSAAEDGNKTLAVRLVFQRQLNFYGALAIVLAIAAVGLFIIWVLGAIWASIQDLRHESVKDRETQMVRPGLADSK